MLKTKTIIINSILLKAQDDAGSGQFVNTNESATKLFPSIIDESHPGAFVDGVFTIDHDAELLVTVAARAADMTPINIIPKVNDIVIPGRADGVAGAPVTFQASVKKGDEFKIVVNAPVAATFSADPILSNLTIRELD